jgi:hypothetical protein
MKELQKNTQYCIKNTQGIAQSGLQSNLVDWIVIDHPNSKSDFWIYIVNPVLLFQSKSKISKLFYEKIKI